MSRLTFTPNMRVLDENSVVAKFKGKEDVAAIGKQSGVKKRALADVANTINQKFTERQTPKKEGIKLPLNEEKFKVFVKSDKKLSKSSKLLRQAAKKKLNIKEKLLLGKGSSMKQEVNEKPIKDVDKLTKAVETVTKEIAIPNKADKNGDFNLKEDDNEKPKPLDVAIAVHVDTEDEEDPVEEFGCSHCSQSVEDDYSDILPEYLRLTPEQIIESAMCWVPKPTVIKEEPFIMPFLPEATKTIIDVLESC